MRFKGKQSLKTIATTLTSLFGLPISKAGIGTLLMQAKEYLKGKYEDLKQAIIAIPNRIYHYSRV